MKNLHSDLRTAYNRNSSTTVVQCKTVARMIKPRASAMGSVLRLDNITDHTLQIIFIIDELDVTASRPSLLSD